MGEVRSVKSVRQKSSDEAYCSDDSGLFGIRCKVETKKAWIASRDLWIAEINKVKRVITPVVIREMKLTTELDDAQKAHNNNGRKKGAYKGKQGPLELLWMDCITGSLFDNSGACKTSDQIKIDTMTIRKGDEEASLILMSTKVDDSFKGTIEDLPG